MSLHYLEKHEQWHNVGLSGRRLDRQRMLRLVCSNVRLHCPLQVPFVRCPLIVVLSAAWCYCRRKLPIVFFHKVLCNFIRAHFWRTLYIYCTVFCMLPKLSFRRHLLSFLSAWLSHFALLAYLCTAFMLTTQWLAVFEVVCNRLRTYLFIYLFIYLFYLRILTAECQHTESPWLLLLSLAVCSYWRQY